MLYVLNIMGSLGCGGAETTVMNFFRAMDHTKIQFDFLITKPGKNHYEEEAVSMGARIFRRPMRSRDPIGNMTALIKLLREHPEFQIIHIHNFTPLIAIDTLIAKWMGVPVRIAHSHSQNPGMHSFEKWFRPLLRATATHYFCCSTEAGEALFGKKAVSSSKLILMLNARNLAPFRFDKKKRDALRQQIKLDGQFVLGTVGRQTGIKNQGFLLDILEKVLEIRPDTRLLLVGDGEEQAKLKSKTEQMSLTNAVMFLGRRDDVSDLLQVMDLFLLPSFYEGLPGVVMEAQAAGLRCLVSDRVTQECRVTSLVEFLPIQEGPDLWVEKIVSQPPDYLREDTQMEMCAAGYDIYSATEKLSNFYFQQALAAGLEV